MAHPEVPAQIPPSIPAQLAAAGTAYWLRAVTVAAALVEAGGVVGPLAPDPNGLVRLDILIEAGVIRRIMPAGTAAVDGLPAVDLDGGMVWPCFVDLHTHIDKGHIWPRRPNPDGTFMGALLAVRADREANWSASDIHRRMDFALRSAFAHGTKALRTHVDALPPQHRITFPVFEDLREAWAGRIELQASSLIPIDMAADPAAFEDVAGEVRRTGSVLGAVTYMVPELEAGLDRMFGHAIEHGLDLDFHVDETADPTARSLHAIAEAAIRHGFDGRIVVGHCCSLARQPVDEADRTLDLVAEAGIGVVSLPMCNMYLQDRLAGRTPRWRGVTLLHEMRARGIPVSVASDNTRDPFYAYGDLDMVEVFREAVRIAHLDHPFGDWPEAVTATPAAMMHLHACGRIRVGGPADLVLFRARTYSEFLSRPQADRVVLRGGSAIDRTLPDYRELDDLM